MAQKFKAHKLFRNREIENAYIDNLEISDTEHSLLRQCRKEVRSALRAGFSNLRNGIAKTNYANNPALTKLTPKFMTQGSYEYGTLNDPAVTPPQQIDLDDGVYFPMELVNNQPQAAKTTLLECVESILLELANSKGWGIERKSTCIRLNINLKVHIDVPVYAIPDIKYQLMFESYNAEGLDIRKAKFSDERIKLDPTEVYLARWDNEDWIQSDPKQLHDWFISKSKQHGKLLKPLCRYIKSWRDKNWIKGGPTSISLMTAVVEIFDNYLIKQKDHFHNDCRALLEIAFELPTLYSNKIYNPVLPSSELFPSSLSEDEIKDIQFKIQEFSSQIIEALCHSKTETEVVTKLTATFGPRIPVKPEWVERLSISDIVKSVPKQEVEKHKEFAETHRSG